MSDLDKLKQLLDEFGVGYEELEREEYTPRTTEDVIHDVVMLNLEQGFEKVSGFYGFFVIFVFKKETGDFIEVGVWE